MHTPLEILGQALGGQNCERIPVFCNLIDQGALELGMHPRDYFSSGKNVAEAQIRMLNKYGHDNAWALFYVGKEAELLGNAEIFFSEKGSPNVSKYPLGSVRELDRYHRPPIEEHPAFVEVKKCLQILRQEIGHSHPICAYFSSSMTLPVMLLGMEKWMEILLLGPSAIRDSILQICHEFFVEHVRAYRKYGANVLIYSNPFGSLDTLPLKLFEQLALPWIQKDLEAVGCDDIVYYCGMSRMNAVIPQLLEKTQLKIFYTSPLDDLNQSIHKLQDRPSLCCGIINDLKLLEWSEDEIRVEVQRIVDLGKQTPRFLFGTGVMPMGISSAKIQTLVQSAKEFGRCSNS